MPFNSWTFLAFFVVVLATYQVIPGWAARKRLLLGASYLFYAAWNPPYVVLLLASTTIDWWLARLIWLSGQPARRRALLTLSLAANLCLLGFFKYGGFLLANTTTLLQALGVDYRPPAWDFILPVGISFYTFASLSYTIDVYRREIRGDCSWRDYALFVSFFPHLVAGPIIRARRLLPQLATERRATPGQLGWGLALVCMGLFSKTVLADAIFAPVVDAVYASPASHGAADVWAAVLSFSGQIYYDFSGYSLAAIGLALCFGFDFPDNFRHPYAARGFSDFWRRWHISLSTWLRDYLYVPLGGNRGTAAATYRNLMLTMLIGGLWHGASWMFVLWGGLHGVYLAVERMLRGEARAARGSELALTALTFAVVTLTWIPFRAHDLGTATAVAAGLLRGSGAEAIGPARLQLAYAAIAGTVAWHLWLRDSSLEARFARLGEAAQAAVIASCLIAMYLCAGGDQHAFIYFQF